MTKKRVFIYIGSLLALLTVFLLIKGPPEKSVPPSGETFALNIIYTARIQGKLLESTSLESVESFTPAEFYRIFLNLSVIKTQGENRREPVIFADLGDTLSGDEDISVLMKGVPMERLLSEIPLSVLLPSQSDRQILKQNPGNLGQRFTYLGKSEDSKHLKPYTAVKIGHREAVFFAMDDVLGPGPDETAKNMEKFPQSLRIVLARTDSIEKTAPMLKNAHLIIPARFSPYLNEDRVTYLDGVAVAPPVDSRFTAGRVRLSEEGGRWAARAAVEQIKPIDEIPPGAVQNVVIEAKNQFEILFRGRYRQVTEAFVIWGSGIKHKEDIAKITGEAFARFSGADVGAACTEGIITPQDDCWGVRQILDLPGKPLYLCQASADVSALRDLAEREKNIFLWPSPIPEGSKTVTVAADGELMDRYPAVFRDKKAIAIFPANFILLDYFRTHRQRLSGDGKISRLMVAGLLTYKKGNPAGALKIWRTAGKLAPENPGIRRLLKTASGNETTSQKPLPPRQNRKSPWPRFRGNSQGTGNITAHGPDTPLLRWKFDTGSQISGSPVLDCRGNLYGGAEDRCLYALDSRGRLLWKFSTGLPVRSTPAIGKDGVVYFGSDDRHLYALDNNGKLKWKFAGGFFFSSSPLIGKDGSIYTGCEDHCIYALNSEGRLKWKFKTQGPIFSSPALGKDQSIYIGSQDHHLYALNPDGSLKWKVKTGHQINSSPAVDSMGRILIGCEDKNLYCISPEGRVLWKGATGNYITSSPAVDSTGNSYVGSEDRHLYAFDKNGKIRWKFKTGGEVISSPLIDRNRSVYVGSDDGILYGINPDGSLKWKFHTRDPVMSSPAMDFDGNIYIGSEDGNFYCIGR